MKNFKIIILFILFQFIIVPAFSIENDTLESSISEYKTLIANKKIIIPITDLKAKYNWNGQEILWKWGDTLSGIEMSSGSVMFLAPSATEPSRGIPFQMGFGGKGFGQICIGNLKVEGSVTFIKDGLLLQKGTKLMYPQK